MLLVTSRADSNSVILGLVTGAYRAAGAKLRLFCAHGAYRSLRLLRLRGRGLSAGALARLRCNAVRTGAVVWHLQTHTRCHPEH